MNTKSIIITLIMCFIASAINTFACTGLIAGKAATTDGSALVTYAADSHTLYGELYNQPAADYPKGAMRKVVEWDTGKYLGEIPEVSHTYRTIGNMNEHGLVIVESTWGGREELVDTTGIIDYGSLIYITLQRAKTAKEAINIMTKLVSDYGYASSGESFTIADSQEVWIMELIGKGNSEKGAVWVAVRVPDDCISGHANHSRIHRFPLNDKENCIYSPDVIKFARKQGYFNGKDEDFSFSLAYAITDASALRGCDARVWSYYNRFADNMDTYLPWILKGEGEVLPLWVKPTRKVSVRDMQNMMRDHFEGTPLDMTQDIGAGPFKLPYRWRPLTYKVDGKEYTHERAIATQQTGFSLVAQLRNDKPDYMKTILWFGVDDANTCVYIPFYNCTTTAPHEFAVGNGDLYTLSWDAAFWVTNYVSNQVYQRYSLMIDDVRKVQTSLEDSIEIDIKKLDREVIEFEPSTAKSILQEMSTIWSKKYVTQYKQLGDYLFVKYLDGNVKKEKDGKFERSPEGMPVYPKFPGYDDKYHRSIVKDSGDRLQVLQPSIGQK